MGNKNKEHIKKYINNKLGNLSTVELNECELPEDITTLSNSSQSVNLDEDYYERYTQDEQTQNYNNLTAAIKKISSKLKDLTKISIEFQQFRDKLTLDLEGKHLEYELKIEDLLDCVLNHSSKQALLFENLKELIDNCNVIKGVTVAEEASQLKLIEIMSPVRAKISNMGLIMSIIIGFSLGLSLAYIYKYNLY